MTATNLKRPTVVGLDISTTGTGLAVLTHDGYRAETITRTTKKAEWSEVEMSCMVHAIKTGIIAAQPKLVAIEGYSHGSHNVAMLAEIGGCVRVMLHELEIPFVVFAPSTLKKFVIGKGKAEKGESKGLMFLNVFKRWNVEFTDDNQCDAYALARMARGIASPSEWKEANECQRSCFVNFQASVRCVDRYAPGLERVGWKPKKAKGKK